MKKLVSVLLFTATLIFVSCQSKEEKASELIKNDLFKTLNDFESYQPIETIVTEAYEELLNDSSCWEEAFWLDYYPKRIQDQLEAANSWKEYAEKFRKIGAKDRYKELKELYKDEASGYNANVLEYNALIDTILDKKSKFDSNKIIGWNVEHRFRCKSNEDGLPTIKHFRYVLSKDFKSIILKEDYNSDFDKEKRSVLENGVNDRKIYSKIPESI